MAPSGGEDHCLQPIIRSCKADVASDVSDGKYPDGNFNSSAE